MVFAFFVVINIINDVLTVLNFPLLAYILISLDDVMLLESSFSNETRLVS